jgi:hypothetical protein
MTVLLYDYDECEKTTKYYITILFVFVKDKRLASAGASVVFYSGD